MFEVIKRRLLLSFLLLTSLILAWSLFVTGKSSSTLFSNLFIVFDNVYMIYLEAIASHLCCLFLYVCVSARERERGYQTCSPGFPV